METGRSLGTGSQTNNSVRYYTEEVRHGVHCLGHKITNLLSFACRHFC